MSLTAIPACDPASHCSAPAPFADAAFEPRTLEPIAIRGEFETVLELRHAGPQRFTLRYECIGARTQPAVFVAGGISAHRHVAASAAFAQHGWWDAQVGAGRALDPVRHCIVSFDWIGADGALDVPIDPADQADAVRVLLDALRIDALHAFIGSSYGAMVGLQFALRHPARLRQLVAISGVHRAHPYASAWRSLQRRAVALGALQCDDSHGLALARQLAILSYRTPEEFDARFDSVEVSNGRVRVGAEDYLDHCGAKYAASTPPAAFIRLSESIDLQALEPERIGVPTTVVAVEEDRLVPIGDARALARRLGGPARLCVLSSRFGHDAFLKETDAIAGILRESVAVAQEVAA